MSFTDGKPFTVNEHELTLFRRRRRFNCVLCGHQFKAADTVRWIYANGTKDQQTGNFFVCAKCDQPNEILLPLAKESLAKAVALAKQWNIYGPDWQDDWQRAEARSYRE